MTNLAVMFTGPRGGNFEAGEPVVFGEVRRRKQGALHEEDILRGPPKAEPAPHGRSRRRGKDVGHHGGGVHAA